MTATNMCSNFGGLWYIEQHIATYMSVCRRTGRGDSTIFPETFCFFFVAVITFFPFLLCKYLLYQLVAYCVCFKMIYIKKSL